MFVGPNYGIKKSPINLQNVIRLACCFRPKNFTINGMFIYIIPRCQVKVTYEVNKYYRPISQLCVVATVLFNLPVRCVLLLQ